MNDPGHPRELLAAYLDDELTLEERSSVDRHLALCASCRKQLASLTALARAVAEEPVPEAPADLAARIGRRIDEDAVVRLPARRRYLVPATIAATIAAVGLLIVVQWQERAPAPRPSARPELQKSAAPETTPETPPPPVEHKQLEYKQDLPVLDRAKAKEPLRRSEAVEPNQEVGGRERVDTFSDSASALAPAPEPAAPPPSTAGAKLEEGVAGAVAAPEAPRDRDAKSQAGEETAHKRAAAPEGRFSQDAMLSDVCGERWVDTGVLGVWFVEDRERSASDLDALARRLGGRVEPVEPNPDQLALVVPRRRLAEMIGALRGRNVAGLEGPFTPEEGFACVRQRIHLESGRRP